MRRTLLLLLTVILAALVFARGTLPAPEPAAEAMAAANWAPAAYNVLDLDLAAPTETAGSARIGQITDYFLSCRPTAKHAYTGALAGDNLILLLAEDWKPLGADAGSAPALAKLRSEGVRFSDVYAPDWYQGPDGRIFALLTGLTPTNVQGMPSLTFLAKYGVDLPFSLAAAMTRSGYTCLACPASSGLDTAYQALGFGSVIAGAAPEDQLEELRKTGPFLLYAQLSGSAEETLERLMQTLDDMSLLAHTAVCLVTGGPEPLRGGLYLWGDGLEGLAVTAPCSELDVTATLLDLYGAAYDARFLSGRDLLADGLDGRTTPPVPLAGSAYAAWVSDAGRYDAAQRAFTPSHDLGGSEQAVQYYVVQTRQQVYDRYVYSRLLLECGYFGQVLKQ